MQITLLYFAALRDLMARNEETFRSETSELTVGQLCLELSESYPQLSLQGVRVAVNEEFVDADCRLAQGDIVAFIPPVSGG